MITTHEPHPTNVGQSLCGVKISNYTTMSQMIDNNLHYNVLKFGSMKNVNCDKCEEINMNEPFESTLEEQVESLKKENDRLKLFIAEQAYYISLAIDH